MIYEELKRLLGGTSITARPYLGHGKSNRKESNKNRNTQHDTAVRSKSTISLCRCVWVMLDRLLVVTEEMVTMSPEEEIPRVFDCWSHWLKAAGARFQHFVFVTSL